MAKKKRNQEEESGTDVGLVMTCSLFLIILTFFILLNSIAVIDEKRQRNALASLIGAFGNLTGGLSASKSGDSVIPPSAPMETDISDLGDLLSMMDKKILRHIKVEAPRNRQQETIVINAAALFDGYHLILKPDVLPVLDRLADFMDRGDYPVEIIGHTDNRPASAKGFYSNWELSGLMAQQVVEYLISQSRLDPMRFTAAGRAAFDPVASNDTAVSRTRNRRVAITLNYEAPLYTKRIYREKPAGVFTYKRFDFKIFNR